MLHKHTHTLTYTRAHTTHSLATVGVKHPLFSAIAGTLTVPVSVAIPVTIVVPIPVTIE